MAESNFAVLY